MFSARYTSFPILQGDCKEFGSVRKSLSNTWNTLEDMNNDVNSIHFQISRNF